MGIILGGKDKGFQFSVYSFGILDISGVFTFELLIKTISATTLFPYSLQHPQKDCCILCGTHKCLRFANCLDHIKWPAESSLETNMPSPGVVRLYTPGPGSKSVEPLNCLAGIYASTTTAFPLLTSVPPDCLAQTKLAFWA